MKLRILVILLLSISAISKAARIKDVTKVEGMRENLLVGYGIVVGLNGSGDNLQNTVFTQKGLEEFLERLGVNIQGASIKTKNIAAVMVTAELPAFARQGTRIDVKVSALGDAKSLRNGTLLVTPLLGADGNVYAVSQGVISIPEFEPSSTNVKTLPANPKLENNGYIQNGAIVENELTFDFKLLNQIKFTLENPDFANSLAIADAINNSIPGNTAESLDPSTVQVTIPNYRKSDVMQFIAEIEALEVKTDYKAKIVINEATGTVVIGDHVTIRPVAIAQGNLIINIAPNEVITANTQLTKQEQMERALDKRRGKELAHFNGSTSLSELVAGLNKLGVWPRDIINVLYSMKSVGALDATIEVR
ncbi:MAG: flagellar basal body P-ring protein FlgI [Rickettsiaceae bacterium]|nr:flagellar basal body P-ring protein FlgI [Rickettsiaceae bacterium]